MRKRKLVGEVGAALALVLGAVWPAAAAPVPRKAAELTMVEPSGKQTPLASFQGKVVVVEFMLTRCPHCWRLAQTLARLDQELGPRGFQPIGIAFDSEVTGQAVADFAGLARVTFPVGYTTAAKVDGFLGRVEQQRFQVPQLVVIDRAGVIRAQSRPTGEVNLEDEGALRHLIVELLQQPAP